jgi:hypothetical protein
MSTKSIDTQSEAALPFFAHLLSGQSELTGPQQEGGPTYHCLDSPCTKKYPSDGDEPTSPTWDR